MSELVGLLLQRLSDLLALLRRHLLELLGKLLKLLSGLLGARALERLAARKALQVASHVFKSGPACVGIRVDALLELGGVREAEQVMRDALELAGEIGDRLIAGRLRLGLGLMLDDVAELELARALFAEIEADKWRAKAEAALARLDV